MLRTLLEKWSRGVVLKRKLPSEFGNRTIYVSPEGGGMRYWNPRLDAIDPMLMQVVRQFVQPGKVIWDIGGNLGFFALPAAVRTGAKGKVVVFEPDLFMAHLLRKTADANPDLQIDILALAVSNREGVAHFNIAERARATNFLAEASGSSQTGGIRRSIAVPTTRLDLMLEHIPPPDLIKIDVEGAENLVLEGMQHIMKTVRPVILCEVFEGNWQYVSASLLSHGYRVCDAARLPEIIDTQTLVGNIIALPA